MIPEEAVGAATNSVIASLCAMDLGWVDTDAPDGVTIDVREFDLTAAIRAALEAAAPYMLAQAFEVSTIQELDALWLGSVVLGQGVSYQRYGNNEWAAEGAWYETGQVELPATVLHDPRNYRPAAERAPYMLNTEGEK